MISIYVVKKLYREFFTKSSTYSVYADFKHLLWHILNNKNMHRDFDAVKDCIVNKKIT